MIRHRILNLPTGVRPANDKMIIYHLVAVEGRSCAEVAQRYEKTIEDIGELVEAVEKWIENKAEVTGPVAIRLLHLQRLEYQWNEAMDAWHRSKQPAKEMRVTTSEGAAAAHLESRTVREQNGDIRFLQHANKVMAEIRDIIDKISLAAGNTNGEISGEQAERLGILRLCATIRKRLGGPPTPPPRDSD